MTTSWRVVLLFALCLLPFIRRPWLFDDPSVVVTARAAARHPWRPYDFVLDLGDADAVNWPRGGYPAYTFPALSSWVLGAVVRVAGEGERPLHAAVFFIMLLSLFIVGDMSEHLCFSAPEVMMGMAFSPIFFLSTLTLYPPLFYFLFYAAALSTALSIRRAPSAAKGLALGLLLTLAALCLHQWPLLVFLVFCMLAVPPAQSPARVRIAGLFGIALFGILYAAWCGWETVAYGMPQIGAVWHVRAHVASYAWRAAFIPCAFLGGGFPATLVSWRFLYQRSRAALGVFMAIGVFFAILLAGPYGGFTGVQSLMLAAFTTTGAVFIAVLYFVARSGEANDRWLVGWFFVEFLFIQIFMPVTSGHHLLALTFPTALLCIRLCELSKFSSRARWFSMGWIAVGTLLLACADQQEARIGPALANDLSALSGSRYYWGNSYSGFCWYLKKAGWRPYNAKTAPTPGDFLLISRNLNAQGPIHLSKNAWTLVGQRAYRIPLFLRTLSISDAAGWYSASWGALPYSFSEAPAEIFTLLQAKPAPGERPSRNQP